MKELETLIANVSATTALCMADPSYARQDAAEAAQAKLVEYVEGRVKEAYEAGQQNTTERRQQVSESNPNWPEPRKFRKKPVVIEAMLWDGKMLTYTEIRDWTVVGQFHLFFCSAVEPAISQVLGKNWRRVALMDPTQDDVDTFLAAGKHVDAAKMEWGVRGDCQDWARWTAPVQLDGVSMGTIEAIFSTSIPRHWAFKLNMHREEVLRWDFKQQVVKRTNHTNRKSCPSNFPASVRQPEHEHCWVEGIGCHCARDLARSVATVDHETALVRFCERVQVELLVPYNSPPERHQLAFP